jgi:hypothetical protein
MFDMVYASVLIFLLSAIGILGLKVAEGAPLLVPLLIGAVVWRIVVQQKLARPLKEMSMHTAADLDRQDLVRLPRTITNARMYICLSRELTLLLFGSYHYVLCVPRIPPYHEACFPTCLRALVVLGEKRSCFCSSLAQRIMVSSLLQCLRFAACPERPSFNIVQVVQCNAV